MADAGKGPKAPQADARGNGRRVLQDPSARKRAEELIARLRANRQRLPSGF